MNGYNKTRVNLRSHNHESAKILQSMGDGFKITCTESSPVTRGGKQKNVELALHACKKLALVDKGHNPQTHYTVQ